VPHTPILRVGLQPNPHVILSGVTARFFVSPYPGPRGHKGEESLLAFAVIPGESADSGLPATFGCRESQSHVVGYPGSICISELRF
jgi:hypothetical protein